MARRRIILGVLRLLAGAFLVAAGVAKFAWPSHSVHDLGSDLPAIVEVVHDLTPVVGVLEVVLGLLIIQPSVRLQRRACAGSCVQAADAAARALQSA